MCDSKAVTSCDWTWLLISLLRPFVPSTTRPSPTSAAQIMAAIMESFDAQMMDYHNDGDVQMHTTHETWFQEATMEDDGLQLHGETHSSSTEFEDVEIDMEENPLDSAQNPEYEMVDEDGGVDYPVGDVDEDDVIVHDISHSSEASANNILEFNPPTDPSTSSFSQGHALPRQEPSLTLFGTSQLGGDGIDVADNHDTSPTIETETLNHADLPPSEPFQASAVEDIGGTSPANEVATETSTDFAEVRVSPELAGSFTQTEQIEQGTEDRDGLPTTNQVEAPTVESSQFHAESAADHDHHSFSGAGSHEVSSNEEVFVGGFPEEETEDSFHEDENEAGAVPTQHGHNSETDFTQVDQNESVIPTTQKDSFEPSEAAALDPPPGVLLSFSHADHPEVCLFSQPNQPETSSAAGHSYKLVFEDNSSLYYEPLSALFDAFRQSEFITTSYDVSLSELAIDAFDLQLVISEDNIFSRETSLYDLHQLHDGSGFSGPLRLRLQSSTPRFIITRRSTKNPQKKSKAMASLRNKTRLPILRRKVQKKLIQKS
ncbi:hypothetical protein L218DRAFT_84418 [Marasmius fiardii PR-910]|nr:hypothetical protein L218DRAFT_84418 [Marasmius fiardii PR-910]